LPKRHGGPASRPDRVRLRLGRRCTPLLLKAAKRLEPIDLDLARAHLLFGEWQRRERRRGESREQLRTACQMLDETGMEAFAERARRDLAAAGETITKRIAQTARTRPGQASELLTSQQAQVARLARDGLSNPEIATRLFISTRTVQYHLSKVFAKLGIKSRAELHWVLPNVLVTIRV
jgi:DNA-binding CsgD family transcriptional regulator